MKAALFVLFTLVPALGSGVCLAAPNLGLDSDQNIVINAQTLTADLNANTATYNGDVVIMRGPVRMRADSVVASFPGGKYSRMEARGKVTVDSPSGTATGDNAVYDVPAQRVHLTGDVRLTKDKNIMRGNVLDVDMNSGKATLTASGGRVQGLFVPQQNGPPTSPGR